VITSTLRRLFFPPDHLLKNKMRSVYIDELGGLVERRSNWSKQKEAVLKTLLELERGGVEPTAWDERLEVGFFDTTTIARHTFGDAIFTGGKLNRNRRTTLNRSLNALHGDGFIDKVGNPYRVSVHKTMWRDFGTNHWGISDAGKKMLADSIKGSARALRREHRFYGAHGIKVDRSQVKRIAASDYAEDWD
jgi:hypothetical protein